MGNNGVKSPDHRVPECSGKNTRLVSGSQATGLHDQNKIKRGNVVI